jgi:hypothetical protein
MSAELHDYRGRITAETHCALEALSRATGKDQQEIVRGILHDWAVQQIHAASVMHRLLQAEGLSGITEGAAGNPRESQGTSGRRRA